VRVQKKFLKPPVSIDRLNKSLSIYNLGPAASHLYKMKPVNLPAVVFFLVMAVSVGKAQESKPPGTLDCTCNNVHPGKYCGGSPYLKGRQGEKCKHGYLFQCSTDGKKFKQYPTNIKHCPHGCGTVAGSTKGIGACKSKKASTGGGGKANGDPAPGDCGCDNTVAGVYCGGSIFLANKRGRGCTKNYLFQCAEDGRGTLPTATAKCADDRTVYAFRTLKGVSVVGPREKPVRMSVNATITPLKGTTAAGRHF